MRVTVVSLAAVLGVLAAFASVSRAADCAERFPEGRFGIPLSHPTAVSATAELPGYAPFYLTKRAVEMPTPDACAYVYTGDVFRMIEARSEARLLAGCLGDFDGDGRTDVALLVKRVRDGAVIPVVLVARRSGYQVTLLDGITDPYGFAEDRSIWPGPFCVPKPASGVFGSEVGGNVTVAGDLFTIGWKTYFWKKDTRRFDSILTSD